MKSFFFTCLKNNKKRKYLKKCVKHWIKESYFFLTRMQRGTFLLQRYSTARINIRILFPERKINRSGKREIYGIVFHQNETVNGIKSGSNFVESWEEQCTGADFVVLCQFLRHLAKSRVAFSLGYLFYHGMTTGRV